jgi:hypothetical protein
VEVEWMDQTRQVTIRDGDTQIVLTVGSMDVLVNNVGQAIDCVPEILPPGRAFVPLRFVSEALGAKVD